MLRIRVTILPAGKRKPDVVEWEYEGDDGFDGAKGLASRISDKGLMTHQGSGKMTIYPVQRIEKVEVFENGQA